MIHCYFENGDSVSLRHVVVDVIIVKDDAVLLGKRGTYNGKPISEYGKWALIGGYLDRDETFIQGAKREVLEETGWKVDNLRLFLFNDNPKREMEDKQNIDIVFVADAVIQTPGFTANEEVSELRWFNSKDLPTSSQIAFDHSGSLVRYFESKSKNIVLPVLEYAT